ncbi:MAG: M18 family aminopeptidase [Clostridia bacterium]|nr:M18 family aminopeptidase [Clostridia bacterium]
MSNQLMQFLESSYTAYHAVENVRAMLLQNGFSPLLETEDWILEENGKYFVERGGAIIAFTVGDLDRFTFKLVASHTDSPALKLKENAVQKVEAYQKLNVEKYGGGIWYTFFDRPLKIAGRIVAEENGVLKTKTVLSDYALTIPSVAIHQNRNANESFAVNAQVDLSPLFALAGEENDLLSSLYQGSVLDADLFLVPADMPYSFGVNGEFLASPRIDNLTSVFSSVLALTSHAPSHGICVAACLDGEEIGSRVLAGAGSDFLENVLRRIASSFKFDETEYFKALASSFCISLDNGHAVHPNHPEKCDPTSRPVLGGGVLIKKHASGAYTSDGVSSAIVKKIFDTAGVKHQYFLNRSDVQSGSTLGAISLSHIGVTSVDLGLAQLAMHSASECFAKKDFEELVNGLTAYYSSDIEFEGDEIKIH